MADLLQIEPRKTGWLWSEMNDLPPGKLPAGTNWPRISIVTPSFNQAPFLEQTINSVLSQGYPNLEYIIIDGGSTDGSIEIIKRYEEHLHYWHSEPDNGQYAAINLGFEHATGEIMAWINSDDLYCPWSFRTVAQVFTQFSHLKWLSTLTPLIWDTQSYCASVHHLAGFSKEAFLDGCYLPNRNKRIGWIQQESTFWRRELWEQVGGLREGVGLAGDFDLWCQFYHLTELYGISSPLAGFRMHGNQRSMDMKGYCEEAEAVLIEFRDSCGYIETRQPLLRRFLARVPKIRVLSELYYKNNIEKYNGIRLVHEGRKNPGLWKEVRKDFNAETYI